MDAHDGETRETFRTQEAAHRALRQRLLVVHKRLKLQGEYFKQSGNMDSSLGYAVELSTLGYPKMEGEHHDKPRWSHHLIVQNNQGPVACWDGAAFPKEFDELLRDWLDECDSRPLAEKKQMDESNGRHPFFPSGTRAQREQANREERQRLEREQILKDAGLDPPPAMRAVPVITIAEPEPERRKIDDMDIVPGKHVVIELSQMELEFMLDACFVWHERFPVFDLYEEDPGARKTGLWLAETLGTDKPLGTDEAKAFLRLVGHVSHNGRRFRDIQKLHRASFERHRKSWGIGEEEK